MHHVSVVNFRGRVAAACSCGDLVSPERFGENAPKQANYDGKIHLQNVEAAAFQRAKQLEAYLSPGYGFADDTGHVVDVTIEDQYRVLAPCPLCEGIIDCGEGLHFENLYVSCDNLYHEFAAYFDGEDTATLFETHATDAGPFETTP